MSSPPPGIASRAFTARLTSTCPSWARSATTQSPDDPGSTRTRTSSPIRCRSICSTSATTSFRSSSTGSSTCLRLNARSWRTTSAARSAARRTWSELAAGVLRQVLRAEQHVGVPADHGEQVVEVVRDAAGELADRLEPRGLRELVLEELALGGVGLEADVRDDLAVRVAERARPERDRDRRAVAAAADDLGAAVLRAVRELRLEVARQLGPVVRRHRRQRPAEHLVGAPAVHRLGRLVPEQHVPVAVEADDPERRGRDQVAEHLVRRAPVLLEPVPLGHVHADAGHLQRPLGVPLDAADGLDPRELAVREHEPVLDVVVVVLLERAPDRLGDVLDVVGVHLREHVLDGAAERARVEAVDPLEVLRPAHLAGRDRPGPDAGLRAVERELEVVAAPAQLVDQPPPLGDVVEDREQVPDRRRRRPGSPSAGRRRGSARRPSARAAARGGARRPSRSCAPLAEARRAPRTCGPSAPAASRRASPRTRRSPARPRRPGVSRTIPEPLSWKIERYRLSLSRSAWSSW